MLSIAAFLLTGDPSIRTFPVPLSSLVPPNELRIEQTAETRPVFAGLRLIVGPPETGTVIDEPADLQGRVQIGTADAALEYVRLLRTPGIWPFLFTKPVMEIRHGGVLFRVPEIVYNDLRVYTVSGWDGVVNDADWKRLDVDEPRVSGGGEKDWSIRRPCLVLEKDKFSVGTLVERVSASGRYVSSVDRLRESPRGIRWSITQPARR